MAGVGVCDPCGRIRYHLLCTPSENLHKSGDDQMQLVLDCLRTHPARLSASVLRRRLSIVGGDGAVVAGGAEAKHASTRSAEKFWGRIMGESGAPPCTEWDLFHRADAAVAGTMRSHPAVEEIMDVAKALGALFGTGDGRALYRSAQHALAESSRRVIPDQGGTRKIVAIANSIQHVVQHLAAVHGSMHARLGLARDGTGAQSQRYLIDLGRRTSSMNFVMFALAVDDVLRAYIVPLALAAQATQSGALSVWRRVAECTAGLSHARVVLE